MQPKPAMRKIFISSKILNLLQKISFKNVMKLKCAVFRISRWWGRQGYSRETLAQIVQYRNRLRGGSWRKPQCWLCSIQFNSYCWLCSYNFSFLWPILLSRKYITNFLLYFQRHLTREFSSLVPFPELLSSNPVFYWRNWLCYSYRKMCNRIRLRIV